MKHNFNLMIISLIASLVSSIFFYFIIRIILNEDILIINSFNSLFFKITTEELSIFTLGFNALFYLGIFFCVLKANGNNLKSKFKLIEYIFWVTIVVFVTYFYLQFIDFNEIHKNYTDILFLIYMSLFIFGFLLFISIAIMILITNNLNEKTY